MNPIEGTTLVADGSFAELRPLGRAVRVAEACRVSCETEDVEAGVPSVALPARNPGPVRVDAYGHLGGLW